MERAGHAARMAVGVVFLAAGLPKAWDPALFYWDVVPFTFVLRLGEETAPLAAKAALLLGPVEAALGTALLLKWRPQWVFPAGMTLMTFFLGLVAAAWWQGYDATCGCFGTLYERGAAGAVVEDVVMLAALGLGWWSSRAGERTTDGGEAEEAGSETIDREAARRGGLGRLWGRGAVVGLVLAGSGAVAGARYASDVARIEGSDLRPGVFLKDLPLRGGPPGEGESVVDLMQGEHLLLVITPTCARCQRAVTRMNLLAAADELPPLVGVSHYPSDSAEMQTFVNDYAPAFPLLTVTRKDFLRLAWKHGYPRLARVRNGEVVRVWESHELPAVEEAGGG